ncbi:MAG: methionine--tRNA ligase, partial [Chloroflexi bacterium]|nr:methionine--tRNA ligase [Chloroflexota bacterium]
EVLMVSGSDQHGTPITIRAEQEGVPPQEVVDRFHAMFLESWDRMGITFDLFTTTGTDNHREVTQDIFNVLLSKGYIYKGTMMLPYCHTCQRSLPDRYVEGTCPHCGNESARGDQCDQCGKPLNPTDLIGLRCRICGDAPEIRESEHFFLKLSAFRDRLLSWVESQTHWRRNVLNFTLQYLRDGLKDRAITRDISWGIPVPQPGFEDKRIYVWFEAVIGYLSASIEWAKSRGTPEKWRDFWGEEVKSYYFIGKDNIPFHTIIWPAMLMGYGDRVLPYDVPANEFLNIEGIQLSTSRNWAVWLNDYLEAFEPDPLRYFLSANMPDTSDSDFSWPEFVRRNNGELVATYGNLVHRVLTITYKNFDGRVPQPGDLDPLSKGLLEKVDAAFARVDQLLYRCKFREAIREVMGLAQEANRYIDQKAPWRAVKEDRDGAATTLWCALSVVSALKTMFYPFLPFSSKKLHSLLGLGELKEDSEWRLEAPSPGQRLLEPTPLFRKLEDEVAEEETAKLGQSPSSRNRVKT